MMVFTQRRVAVAGMTFACLLGALVASAQTPSLGDVAKKEEARRKTAQPAEKVLTNKDLPQVSSPPPPPSSSEPAAAAEGTKPEPDKTAPEKPEKDEAWWRGRITEAREALARDQVLLDALQARVNGLTADFAGRDDPYQRARVGEDRQKALGEMERVRADIDRLKKTIEDIEEEARKAGVPPGWLR